MKRRPLVVEVHDLHVDVKINGKIIAHSEDYSTPHKAREAANTLIDAMDTRPTRLVYWWGRQGSQVRHEHEVRKLWAIGRDEFQAMRTSRAVRMVWPRSQ